MARTTSTADKSLQVTVKPFGPTTKELLAIGARVAAGASKLRPLYTECFDDQDEAKVARPLPPSRFRATFYDDSNLDVPVEARSPLARKRPSGNALPTRGCPMRNPWPRTWNVPLRKYAAPAEAANALEGLLSAFSDAY